MAAPKKKMPSDKETPAEDKAEKGKEEPGEKPGQAASDFMNKLMRRKAGVR